MKMRLAACPQPARPPASPADHRPRAVAATLALVCLLATLAGCYPVTGERAYCQLSRSDPGLPDERSKRVPMMRIGSLPHPYGPIPVRYGDRDALGQHTYRQSAWRSVRLGEASGGIIYTTRVGFVDLAHTRNAADLTYLAYQRIHPALEAGRPRVLLAGAEPTLFLVHLDYPDAWHTLDPDARARFAQEIAVLLAVRMGYIISSWHEVLTSFGFRGVMVIPEVQSAFVYDDQPSHLLGAVAAGRALRIMHADGTPYNDAMTTALAELLDDYGALDTPGTRRAVAAARGVWWDVDNATTARQIHLGMVGEPFTPLLIHPDHPEVLGPQAEGASTRVSTPQNPGDIPKTEDSGEASNPEARDPAPHTPDAPWSWVVPDLRAAAAGDPALAAAVPAVRITLDPQVGFADELRAAAGLTSGTPWLDLDRDGPALKAHLHTRLNE